MLRGEKNIVRASAVKLKESSFLSSQYPLKVGVGLRLDGNKVLDLMHAIARECEFRGVELLDFNINHIELVLDEKLYEVNYVEKLGYFPSLRGGPKCLFVPGDFSRILYCLLF